MERLEGYQRGLSVLTWLSNRTSFERWFYSPRWFARTEVEKFNSTVITFHGQPAGELVFLIFEQSIPCSASPVGPYWCQTGSNSMGFVNFHCNECPSLAHAITCGFVNKRKCEQEGACG